MLIWLSGEVEVDRFTSFGLSFHLFVQALIWSIHNIMMSTIYPLVESTINFFLYRSASPFLVQHITFEVLILKTDALPNKWNFPHFHLFPCLCTSRLVFLPAQLVLVIFCHIHVHAASSRHNVGIRILLFKRLLKLIMRP